MPNDQYAPTIATARIKWWTPRGLAFLAARSLFHYFITGYNGKDNATFWHDATKDYRDRPIERLSKARWRRVARRWAFIIVPFWVAMAGIFEPMLWKILALYALAAFIGASIVLINHAGAWWASRELLTTHVQPAAAILAKLTGTSIPRRMAPAYIELPPGFGETVEGEVLPARVRIPEVPLDDRLKKKIAEEIGSRLGMPKPQAHWIEANVAHRFVELAPAPLPKKVTLAQIMDALKAADIDHPVIGMDQAGNIVHTDFRNDSPHTLGSAGSGGGKSTLYKFIAMQRMSNGAYAIFLDFKKWSHLRWAGRLPKGRVLIEDEVPAIHDVLVKVMDELLRRKRFNLEDEAKLKDLPVLDIFVEEINTLMPMLVDYWTEEVARQKQAARTALRRAKRAEDDDLIDEAEEELARANGLPKTSPAIQALRYGVNLGREFSVHFHFIGQSMSAKAAGGRDTRESFKTRLLAQWDLKTWKMLADGIPFIACPAEQRGIWAHVHGSSVEIVRVPFVADEDAVNFVLDGIQPSMPMFYGDPRPAFSSTSTSAIPSASTLKDLVQRLPSKADGERLSLDGLRTASKRPGFPAKVNEPGRGEAALYDAEEVLAWFRDRERALGA